MSRKTFAALVDDSGFERILANLAPEKRVPVMQTAMLRGAVIVQKKVRSVWKASHPDSDLDRAILIGLYPSGEGAVARRHYVKGGEGRDMDKRDPKYRAYILNFFENGTKPRTTKGKIGSKYPRKRLNRGAIKALKMFAKGYSRRNAAIKEIERYLLVELAKQARK